MSTSQRQHLIMEFVESMHSFRKVFGTLAENQPQGLPTKPQIDILYFLSHHPHPLATKELAKLCWTSSSAITQQVDGLVKDGLVSRNPDDKDRRRLDLSITPKGSQALEQAKHYRQQLMERMLQTLTNDELALLLSLQQKIINRLSAHQPGSSHA